MLTTTNIPSNNFQNHLTNPKHSSNIPDRPSSSFNFSSSSSSSSINSLSSSKRKKQNGVWWGILEEKEEENKFNYFDSRSSLLLNKNNRYLNHRSSSLILHRNGTFRQKGPAQKIISVERPPIYYYLFKRNYINLRAHKSEKRKNKCSIVQQRLYSETFVVGIIKFSQSLKPKCFYLCS
ncbi:unnamed protein product [Meloidogyne enterolobii]|uniref:Uncharacterized protein n=1 Tax=Meloidogyne enterolobii TaxID=390850 RepID=A0ACB0YDP9_MELEN